MLRGEGGAEPRAGAGLWARAQDGGWGPCSYLLEPASRASPLPRSQSPGLQPASEACPDIQRPSRLPRRSPSARIRTGKTRTLHVRAAPGAPPLPRLCPRPARAPCRRHSPQPDGQQVGQQQRWQEDLEELRRKDAALLHDACVAHAERGSALRVLEEQELPEGRGRSAGAGTRPRRPPRTQTHLAGGTFSGRLDQSQIQSEFFFRMLSTSFLLSM